MLFTASTQELTPVTVTNQVSFENIDHCTEVAEEFNKGDNIYIFPNGSALVMVARCDTPL
jgi:hypothetical protein